MRAGHKMILSNAEREVEYVGDLVRELSIINETKNLWRAWQGILDHYVKAVSAMRRATDQGSSKVWSDSLLHQQRSDEILKYAHQARDSVAHVFEEKREVKPRSVSIGNFIRIHGNSSITFSNNYCIDANGLRSKLPDGVLTTENGRYASGSIPKVAVVEQEHYLVVADVKNRSGTWCIPNPNTSPEKRATEIAMYVADWLEDKLREAKKLSDAELI